MIETPRTNRHLVIPFVRAIGSTMRFRGSVIAAAVIFALSGSLSYSSIATLFLLFSYLFNDYCDIEKDKAAHPNRPLPKGEISKATARNIALFLFIGGILLSFTLEPERVTFFAFIFTSSMLYSLFLKRWVPALATPWWCFLGTMVFLVPISPSYLQATAVFSFFLARELLLDFRDRRADALFCKTPTIPNLLGHHTFTLVLTLQLASLAASACMRNTTLVVGNCLFLLPVAALCRAAWSEEPWVRDGREDFRELRFATNAMWFGLALVVAL